MFASADKTWVSSSKLFFLRDVQSGLVWMTKILTDPFHDIALYYKAPLALVRGELIEPAHGKSPA